MKTCEICGEDINNSALKCPFCESTQTNRSTDFDFIDFELDDSKVEIDEQLCKYCNFSFPQALDECPFCDASPAPKKKKSTNNKIPSVNIKEDMPTVDIAIKRFEKAINNANSDAVKIIHGYGSTGKGGLIKAELHRECRRLIENNKISDFIPGEKLNSIHQITGQYINQLPQLKNDHDYKRQNKGITIIIL